MTDETCELLYIDASMVSTLLIHTNTLKVFTWKKNITDSLANARTGSITRVPSAIWIITNCHARRGSVAGLVWSKDCVKRTLILGRILTTITCEIKQHECWSKSNSNQFCFQLICISYEITRNMQENVELYFWFNFSLV